MIIDLVKAEQNSEVTAKIKGVISTEAVDLQGEIVKQSGLDFSHFKNNGVFNYEHRPGAENVLGYPTSVVQKGKTTEIEGVLLLEQPRALEIFRLAKAMERAGRSRKIGFSVEGQIIDRDPYNPNIVRKAKVLHCAITTNPVNPHTALSLVKSMLVKGNVGYQTPAVTTGGVQSLIPQQLDDVLSVADSESLRPVSFKRIIKVLFRIFPLVSVDKLSVLARHIEKEMSRT